MSLDQLVAIRRFLDACLWPKVVMELNRQFEWKLVLLQGLHCSWVDDDDAADFVHEVVECRQDDAILFVGGRVRVGDEACLLGAGVRWAPGADDGVCGGVVFQEGPVVVLVDLSLVHELEQVGVAVLGHALELGVVCWKVDAAKLCWDEVLHVHRS